MIYFVHAIVVAATAYFAAASDIANWYFVLLIGLPLVLASVPRLSGISYSINARILFPLSVGLLCGALYHYFPTVVVNGDNALTSYIIRNSGRGVESDFFEVNAIFKDSVSVLYAICAAFLLWKGLTDFDELKHVLHDEANEIRTIADFSGYFINSGQVERNWSSVQSLRHLLLEYLSNMLKGRRVVANSENENVLMNCIAEIGKLEGADTNDNIALEEIMKSISRISMLRSRRAVCIEKQMSPYILGLMLLMSVTMVASFFGKASSEFSIDYAYVVLLPAFYTAIFMTLLDLSSPFDGYWSIKLGAVIGVREKIEKQLAEMESASPLVNPQSQGVAHTRVGV
ncbi:MAG: DUF4239 domain-containing protein [Maritimibacter sp.]